MGIPRSKKAIVVLVSTVVAVGALAATALSGVITQTITRDGENIHYRIVRTVADGFDSGWHIHPGLAVVQVQEGSLQITQGSCTPKTVGPGDTFIEVPFVPVRAVGLRVIWTTTLFVPYDDPVSMPTPSPCP